LTRVVDEERPSGPQRFFLASPISVVSAFRLRYPEIAWKTGALLRRGLLFLSRPLCFSEPRLVCSMRRTSATSRLLSAKADRHRRPPREPPEPSPVDQRDLAFELPSTASLLTTMNHRHLLILGPRGEVHAFFVITRAAADFLGTRIRGNPIRS